MSTAILIPIYGRDYPSKKAVEAAFKEGKDFEIYNIVRSVRSGEYCTIDELNKENKYTHAQLRYKRMTMVTVVKLK